MPIGGAESVDAAGDSEIVAARIPRKDHSVPGQGRHGDGFPIGRIAQSGVPRGLARSRIEREHARIARAAKQFAIQVGGSATDAEPTPWTRPIILPFQGARGRIHGVGAVVGRKVEHSLHHQQATLERRRLTCVIGADGVQILHVGCVDFAQWRKPRGGKVAVVTRPFGRLRKTGRSEKSERNRDSIQLDWTHSCHETYSPPTLPDASRPAPLTPGFTVTAFRMSASGGRIKPIHGTIISSQLCSPP